MKKFDANWQRYHMHHLAINKHYGQKYGDRPYIEHIYDVEKLLPVVLGLGDFDRIPEEYTTVAYGHDIIEDTDVTADFLLKEGFSKRIVDAIVSVSKVKGETYDDYIARVKKNKIGLAVKKADTLANLTASIKEANLSRIIRYSRQLERLYN